MSDFVELHIPCEKCPSSDGASVNSDGWATCFVCGERWKHIPGVTRRITGEPLPQIPMQLTGTAHALPARGISREICEKFRYYSNASEHIATYCDAAGNAVAQKVRRADKSFTWRGEPKRATLFGRQLWRDGGRRIVITEGEIDALSVAQANGGKWPVVSVKDGSSGAAKNIAAELQWLESYDEVVLCFDADEPGSKAALQCAKLFSAGKCKIATLPGGALKDANDMLLAGKADELIRACWDARSPDGDGIVAGIDMIDQLVTEPVAGLPYPWEFLNEAVHGIRPGEIVTWGAGTGIGKSTIVRHIIHGLQQRGERCGVVALEESAQEAALAQVSLAMGRRLHVPRERAAVGSEDIRVAGKLALENVWFYDTQGQGVGVESVVPKLRFMAKALGVKWVVLDHISIMTGGDASSGDERKRIDELMYALRDAALQLGIGLQLVCHLRKSQGERTHEEGGRVTLDDFRGSGAIKQVSNIIFCVERNQQGSDASSKVATVRSLKNRFTGDTGRLGMLSYSPLTGLLDVYTEPELPEASTPFGSNVALTPKGDF